MLLTTTFQMRNSRKAINYGWITTANCSLWLKLFVVCEGQTIQSVNEVYLFLVVLTATINRWNFSTWFFKPAPIYRERKPRYVAGSDKCKDETVGIHFSNKHCPIGLGMYDSKSSRCCFWIIFSLMILIWIRPMLRIKSPVFYEQVKYEVTWEQNYIGMTCFTFCAIHVMFNDVVSSRTHVTRRE